MQWDQTKWYRESGDDTIYTWRARLVSIPIICGLVGLLRLDDFLFDSTRLGNVIGTVLLVPTLFFGLVLIIGRLTNDAD